MNEELGPISPDNSTAGHEVLSNEFESFTSRTEKVLIKTDVEAMEETEDEGGVMIESTTDEDDFQLIPNDIGDASLMAADSIDLTACLNDDGASELRNRGDDQRIDAQDQNMAEKIEVDDEVAEESRNFLTFFVGNRS